MKKLSGLPLGYSQWRAREEILPIGTAAYRAPFLDEALKALARFAGWKDSNQQIKARLIPQVGSQGEVTVATSCARIRLMDGLERICAALRLNLLEQESYLPPGETRKNLHRISLRLQDALLLFQKDRGATRQTLVRFEGHESDEWDNHDQFTTALEAIEKVRTATEAASRSKEPVRWPPRGNWSTLHFLDDCRTIMLACHLRKVSLGKTTSHLLSFAEPLYTYATGRKVGRGSFDRVLAELGRRTQPLDFLWTALKERQRECKTRPGTHRPALPLKARKQARKRTD